MALIMDSAKRILQQYSQMMDQEIVAVQLGCYSIALLGLTAAVRKVRPFSRFKRPKDIPNRFLEERRELIGSVRRIDPNGALLMIDHKPLIPLPIIPKGELPVKILGVKVSGLGISWLQSIVVDSNVTFIPVKKEDDFVYCEVHLPNTKPVNQKFLNKDKQSRILIKLLSKKEEPFLNVGECLVKIGFAELSPLDQNILSQRQSAHYYKSLHSAEIYALKKKLGMKYYFNPVKAVFEGILLKAVNTSKQLLTKVNVSIQNIPAKMNTT